MKYFREKDFVNFRPQFYLDEIRRLRVLLNFDWLDHEMSLYELKMMEKRQFSKI